MHRISNLIWLKNDVRHAMNCLFFLNVSFSPSIAASILINSNETEERINYLPLFPRNLNPGVMLALSSCFLSLSLSMDVASTICNFYVDEELSHMFLFIEKGKVMISRGWLICLWFTVMDNIQVIHFWTVSPTPKKILFDRNDDNQRKLYERTIKRICRNQFSIWSIIDWILILVISVSNTRRDESVSFEFCWVFDDLFTSMEVLWEHVSASMLVRWLSEKRFLPLSFLSVLFISLTFVILNDCSFLIWKTIRHLLSRAEKRRKISMICECQWWMFRWVNKADDLFEDKQVSRSVLMRLISFQLIRSNENENDHLIFHSIEDGFDQFQWNEENQWSDMDGDVQSIGIETIVFGPTMSAKTHQHHRCLLVSFFSLSLLRILFLALLRWWWDEQQSKSSFFLSLMHIFLLMSRTNQHTDRFPLLPMSLLNLKGKLFVRFFHFNMFQPLAQLLDYIVV